MNQITALTDKIDDCNTAIESMEQLIKKHELKPLSYALTYIKQEKTKTIKALATAKLDIDVDYELVGKEPHYI